MHTCILALTFQDGSTPFPITRLPVLNSMTDSSQHTLLLPALHSQWSCHVYIIHRSITGFLVVQGPKPHVHMRVSTGYLESLVNHRLGWYSVHVRVIFTIGICTVRISIKFSFQEETLT